MHVSPISICQISYARNSQQNNNQLPKVAFVNGTDTVAFTGGPNPVVVRNQLKILLTQDIWAPKLKVKMPETELEKEVLLEVLENRQRLDRYTRLSNSKFTIKSQIDLLNNLLETDPTNPRVQELAEVLAKHGNLESTLKTIDKDMEMEIKKNKSAWDYFKNIEALEDEYSEKKLVKTSMLEKFFNKIRKNNINADEKYSTKELIEIISGNKSIKEVEAKVTPQIMSKKQLIAEAGRLYEQKLREIVDIYEGRLNHHNDASEARKAVNDFYESSIKKYPDVRKALVKAFETAEAKFMHKVRRIEGVDIYPIGEIWQDMAGVERTIKTSMNSIVRIKTQLAKNPNNKELLAALQKEETLLAEAKTDWIKGAKLSVQYEQKNQERMIAAGRGKEYQFLAGENKVLKRHNAALEILNQNNDTIPEDAWLSVMG